MIWQTKVSGLMSMYAHYRESIDRCAKPVTDGRKKMAEGFIKLHRSIKDCWLWKDDEPFSKRDAWIDLLLLANYTDKKILLDGKLTTIKAGQFHTSILKLSERWKWSRNKTRRFLEILESDEMISTERTAHGTTLTLVNWGRYQHRGTTDGTTEGQSMDSQWYNRRTVDGTQLKKEKKEKEFIKKGKNEPNPQLKKIEELYMKEVMNDEL